VRSPRETRLRLLVLDSGLPEPEINYWIYDDRGRFLTESDLVYPREKVVLEYEGDHHRTDVKQWRKDIARRESLEDAGWRVIRVSADDLDLYPDRLITRIRRALARPRS
jgi:very-short-patch-repair endonuclease